MTIADVLVIGGGPAGAAAAARLAAGGLRVVLCERRREPERQVCGEFVSAAATAELAALGLQPARLGARPIARARVRGHNTELTAPLPFTGYGLSRACLDRSLRTIAAGRGAELRLGVGVRSIERRAGAWTSALSDGGSIRAGTVILATGKHELRGHARAVRGGTPVVGFKMHYRLRPDAAAALDGTVELVLYDGGYAGLQLVDSDVANLCLIMPADRVRGGGPAWQNALAYLRQAAPPLGERLRDAAPLWQRPASIARVPYGYVCTRAAAGKGLYRVGDQAAVIPSIAGEGIAIALQTARRAADAVLAGQAATDHVAAVRRDVLGPMRRSGLLEGVLRQRSLRRIGLRIATVPCVVPLLASLTRLTSPDQQPAIRAGWACHPEPLSPDRR
jgi:flavin-dependent dehydrogenase